MASINYQPYKKQIFMHDYNNISAKILIKSENENYIQKIPHIAGIFVSHIWGCSPAH